MAKDILIDKESLVRFLNNLKGVFSPINHVHESLEFKGSMSLGRDENSVEGENSIALGANVVADSPGSFAMGEEVQAIAPGTHAEGKETLAGCKGYYYKYIDLENKKIYIAEEQPTIENPAELVTEEMVPVSSYEPAWPAGTGIALYNQATLWNEIFVESIAPGIITYTGELSLEEIYMPEEMSYDTFAIYAPEYPYAGVAGVTYGGHAEGWLTWATGNYTHAEGGVTKALGNYSHAEGRGSEAIGGTAHAEGNYTIAQGGNSHSEGRQTRAMGAAAHAEGDTTKAIGDYSHAEGYQNEVAGRASHVEGHRNFANGDQSHAEGRENTATGKFSHVEGRYSESFGDYSHAEGRKTLSEGMYSHAEGYGTIARGQATHVQGKFNLDNSAKYAHVVGNGSSDTERSNAHTLDWNGNAWFAGKVDSSNIKDLTNRVGKAELQLTDVETNKENIEALDKMVNYRVPFAVSLVDAKNYFTISTGKAFYMTADTYGDNWNISDKTTSSLLCTGEDNLGYMRLFLEPYADIPHFRAMSSKKDYVFNFTSPASGKYNLATNLFLASSGGSADIYVNDTYIGTVDTLDTAVSASPKIGEVTLKEGELANELKIVPLSGRPSFIDFTFEDINEFNEKNHEYRLIKLEEALFGIDEALDNIIDIQNELIGGNN